MTPLPGPEPLPWRHTLVAAALAIWLGGLVFYATLVVPIGADVLGSHTAFGFVTRRVTAGLNHLATGVLLLLLLHLLVPARRRPPRSQWWTLAVMVACQVALYALHPWLDSLLDPVARTVQDPDAFYTRHRIYLLTTALQVVAGVLHGRGLVR